MVIRCVIVLFVLASVALAHPGDVDSNGGHWNQANGEYHYHHGWPAHHHPRGVCPYNNQKGQNVSGPSIGIKGEFQGLYPELTPYPQTNRVNYTHKDGSRWKGVVGLLFLGLSIYVGAKTDRFFSNKRVWFSDLIGPLTTLALGYLLCFVILGLKF